MTYRFVALVSLALIVSPAVLAQSPLNAALVGEIVVPSGLKIAGVEFGGISGLDYDAENDVYYAVSDDRSQKAPARFYVLKLAIDDKGISGLDIVSTHELMGPDGKAFAEKTVDAEAIRFNGATKTLYWSSEGNAEARPTITEAGLDGSFIREFTVPDYYAPNADGTQGVTSNLAFEALAISSDGTRLLAGTENALAQDGGKATLETGSPSRIISFDLASGAPVQELIYETGKIFTKATTEPAYNDNGLSDFMTLNDTTLLTVERSFASGIGNQIDLFSTELAGATDVSGKTSVKDMSVTGVAKTHLLTLAEGDFGLDIDNIEAISFGPTIGGRTTLVIASDNNFNLAQFTQFVVLAVDLPK